MRSTRREGSKRRNVVKAPVPWRSVPFQSLCFCALQLQLQVQVGSPSTPSRLLSAGGVRSAERVRIGDELPDDAPLHFCGRRLVTVGAYDGKTELQVCDGSIALALQSRGDRLCPMDLTVPSRSGTLHLESSHQLVGKRFVIRRDDGPHQLPLVCIPDARRLRLLIDGMCNGGGGIDQKGERRQRRGRIDEPLQVQLIGPNVRGCLVFAAVLLQTGLSDSGPLLFDSKRDRTEPGDCLVLDHCNGGRR
mmetsp:Transcript_54186/g.89389  ORF Transcript_54186/g.89389 Transcript_54186/m.89389 type:complete len:248 (+) Transcript_54186:194-937(+)